MESIEQFDDGTLAFVNSADALKDLVVGGPTSPTATAPRFSVERVAKMSGNAADSAGGVISWQNNTGRDVIVTRAVVDVLTIATAACSISVGQTSVSGTTSSANLIDTLDVHTATGTFDNITDKGANGKSRQKVANGNWVTASKASGAAAGLVSNIYLLFVPV